MVYDLLVTDFDADSVIEECRLCVTNDAALDVMLNRIAEEYLGDGVRVGIVVLQAGRVVSMSLPRSVVEAA